MKMITGMVTSSKPISLSKASKTIEMFCNTNTGASQIVNVYLKRSSASFNELVNFHKNLKSSHKSKKRNTSVVIEGFGDELRDTRRIPMVLHPSRMPGYGVEESEVETVEKKKKKKVKRERSVEDLEGSGGKAKKRKRHDGDV